MEVEFQKTMHATDVIQKKTALFSMNQFAYSNEHALNEISTMLQETRMKIIKRIDQYTNEGSGWIISGILNIKLQLCLCVL